MMITLDGLLGKCPEFAWLQIYVFRNVFEYHLKKVLENHELVRLLLW